MKVLKSFKRKLNEKNKTSLHYAANYNKKEILEILISKGADVNAKDILYMKITISLIFNMIKMELWIIMKENKTPLDYVTYENSEAIKKYLISKGAFDNSHWCIIEWKII